MSLARHARSRQDGQCRRCLRRTPTLPQNENPLTTTCGAPGIPLPSAGLVPWILVVGLTGLTAHYALTSALSWAPASVVAPMEFIRLPVLATLGMLVYGEPFDPVVFLGAGAIVLGNLVNLRGERTRTAA